MGFVITRGGARAVKDDLIKKTSERRKSLACATAIERAASAPGPRNDLLPKLKWALRDVKDLKAAPRRMRKSDPAQVERVIASIKTLGVCTPVIIDAEGRIVDGHILWEAAKTLELDQLPCVIVDHLQEHELELLRISLNRIGELGEWDLDELRPVLVDLGEIGFDLTVTGFSLPEIDIIMLDGEPLKTREEEEEVEPPLEPVSRLGDVWLLGSHRLLCGDSLDPDSYTRVMGDELADACFTDCPWNIPIEGFVSGLGKKTHKDFKMAAGEMTNEQFVTFVDTFSQRIAERLADGAVYYSCIDWRSENLIRAGAEKVGLTMINMAIWSKGSGGMGGLYRSAHELVPVFCKGTSPKTNNVKLGKHGRDRTNVWTYPGANRRGSSAGKALAHHPTPKPVELVEDALLDVTNRGDIVVDPFLGSGTTLLAAERSGRQARGIELDPGYVDVCIRRWKEMTGQEAVHEETGLSFADMAEDRAQDGEDQPGG